MARFANEMLTKAPSNVEPRASKTSSNRFKNQYLSSFNSSRSKKEQTDPGEAQERSFSEEKLLRCSQDNDDQGEDLQQSLTSSKRHG